MRKGSNKHAGAFPSLGNVAVAALSSDVAADVSSGIVEKVEGISVVSKETLHRCLPLLIVGLVVPFSVIQNRATLK